jgi:hypothetical protein
MAAEHVQRAAFVAVLAFVFFVASMFLFYVRESLLYFLLSSGFLVVYLITMLSWVIQRKNVVQIFEGGFSYKAKQASWDQVSKVGDDGTVTLKDDKQIIISPAMDKFPELLELIRRRAEQA